MDEEIDDYDSEDLKDPNCPWYNEDVQFETFDENNQSSKIETSEKFLLGIFPYGPNNQLRGFRDTITLAIKLNRTVVLPKFFMHRTARDHNLQLRLAKGAESDSEKRTRCHCRESRN